MNLHENAPPPDVAAFACELRLVTTCETKEAFRSTPGCHDTWLGSVFLKHGRIIIAEIGIKSKSSVMGSLSLAAFCCRGCRTALAHEFWRRPCLPRD